MNFRQKALLYHEMAKMLGAGLNLQRSIDVLLDQSPSAAVRRYLKGLLRGLQEHLTAAEAIAKHNGALVGEMEIHMVEAGERGGRLAESFHHLSTYFDLRAKAQKKAVRALLYPTVLLHMGLMLPDLSKIMAGSGLQRVFADGAGRVLIAWVIIAVGVIIGKSIFTASRTSVSLDRFLSSLPLIGPLRRHWALARFCQVMEMALMAALKMSDAVRLGGASSQSAAVARGAEKTAAEIEKGGTLSGSMKASGAFPRSFVNGIQTAEVSGTLDVEMRQCALMEIHLASSALDRAAEWFPRIAYGIIVLYVVTRILQSFMGIYGPNGFYQSILRQE